MDILEMYSSPAFSQFSKRTSVQLVFLLISLIKCYVIRKKDQKEHLNSCNLILRTNLTYNLNKIQEKSFKPKAIPINSTNWLRTSVIHYLIKK